MLLKPDDPVLLFLVSDIGNKFMSGLCSSSLSWEKELGQDLGFKFLYRLAFCKIHVDPFNIFSIL